jgi:hypothetical protein
MDLPWVDVTVRTNPGQKLSVFGAEIRTEDEQRWIYGSEATNPLAFERPPFWVPAALEPVTLGRLRTDHLQYLDQAVGGLEFDPGDEAARVRSLRRIQEDANAQFEQLASVESSGEIYFPLNGKRVGVKLYTDHEGWLERIHIDTPEGRSGDEVTVIGYYSGSADPVALMRPRKSCIWCGDVQICSAGATCP